MTVAVDLMKQVFNENESNVTELESTLVYKLEQSQEIIHKLKQEISELQISPKQRDETITRLQKIYQIDETTNI